MSKGSRKSRRAYGMQQLPVATTMTPMVARAAAKYADRALPERQWPFGMSQSGMASALMEWRTARQKSLLEHDYVSKSKR